MVPWSVGRTFGVVGALVVALGCVGCGASTVGKQWPGVGNVGKVARRDDPSAFFFRGNQPTEQGIVSMKRRGVKTVINLRADFDPREERWVRAAGMDYLLIKTTCNDIQPLEIATFMGQMRQFQRDPDRWPVFVHCRYGCDRTGLYVAVWRIAEEGWSREEAIDELMSYGHNRIVCHAIVPFLRRFDVSLYRGK